MGSYARSLQGTMLSNLTSLIWGTTNNEVDATPTVPSPDPSNATVKDDYEDTPEGFISYDIRTATPTDEEEGDWVLVDRAEVGEASCGGAESILGATATSPSALAATTTINTTTTTTTTSAAITAPVPPVTQGEWSEGGTQDWLMTPPPCFTRSQPALLASSSLENLLIEHPSMSVYLPCPTHTSASTTTRVFRHVLDHSSSSSCSPPSASSSSHPAVREREDSPMKEQTHEEAESQVAEAPPARGVSQRPPTLLQAIDILRPAQKAQRRREERRLKRSALERNNKVREVAASGNKRAKRCDQMAPGKFSRAVNNRKC